MKKPLEGIRIIDFTHVISGPFCSMLLGDLGAEVIKIEKPGTGEFYRAEGIKNKNGVSIVYPNYNRNKKGITINLKSEDSKLLIKNLVAISDVFIENFRPGALKQSGLAYEDLKIINPKIIYASISGFGQTGPYASKTAFDMTIAAISGLMSVNGQEGQEPMKSGAAFSDFLSGVYAALGIVSAIRQRDFTGEGTYIDVAMMDSIISVLDAFIPQCKLTGIDPPRMGNRRVGFAPVNVFRTKDGYVYIAASFQVHWECLAKLMNKEELISDIRFDTTAHRKENEPLVEGIVSEWTKTLSLSDAVSLLEKSGVPCAPVKTMSEVIADEHVKERKSIVEFEYPGIGTYPTAAFPVRFSHFEPSISRAPLLGEHNEEVICDLLGYSKEKYEKLIEEKSI